MEEESTDENQSETQRIMETEKVTDWFLVNQLVKPEHQYQDVVDPPMEAVRMAWPFKTDAERKLIIKWRRKQTKVRRIETAKLGEALL